ncbi:MAG: hypothetical protein M1819_007257 [Sarea resinae]|nr:MAG: hypothetical protein M1819_007257 [Sarea resinae]
MSFPPPPVEHLDWENLGIAAREVNGHVQSTYSAAEGKWTEPEFVRDPYLRVHGFAPGLNYGQQAYEGLKAYRTPANEIQIFRPHSHALRLQASSAYVSIPAVPTELFTAAVSLAVALNAAFVPPSSSAAGLYIRPVVFGSGPQPGLQPSPTYTFAVLVAPFTAYHGRSPLPAVVMDDFDRCAPRGTGAAKVGGNYAPLFRHADAARRQGWPVTLHLDAATRSQVEEFATSGFVGVGKRRDDTKGQGQGQGDGDRGGDRDSDNATTTAKELITLVVPSSPNVLPSITSSSILTLARSFGWAVEQRAIAFDELGDFDEVLAVGTAAAVLPIRSITRPSTGQTFVFGSRSGGDGKTGSGEIEGGGSPAGPGECCQRLQEALSGVQKGERADEWGWCFTVHEPAGWVGHGDGVAVRAVGGRDEQREKEEDEEKKKGSRSSVGFLGWLVGWLWPGWS